MDKRRIFFIIFVLFSIWLLSGIFVNIFTISKVGQIDPFSNVAFVKINDEIVTDSLYSGKSSSDIISLLKLYSLQPNIKAILLEINSPGGSAVASKEIVDEIKRLRELNITVVSYIRDIGASGAYWISSATEHIFASEFSMVGSIGVTSSYLEFSGFLRRYNITYEQLTSGKYKDLGTPFRELTNEEKDIIDKQLMIIHELFIRDVAKNRNMSYDSLKLYSDGKIFLGIEARKFGLIDSFGGRDDAISYIENKLNITVVLYEPLEDKSLFSLFGNMLLSKNSPVDFEMSRPSFRT